MYQNSFFSCHEYWKRLRKKFLTIGGYNIENRKFHYFKYQIYVEYLDIERILVSNKVFFGERVTKTFLVRNIMKKLSYYV